MKARVFFSHVLGYTGRVTEKNIKENSDFYLQILLVKMVWNLNMKVI